MINSKPSRVTDSISRLQERRNAALGPAYRHFYQQPLRPVRGQDVWLYDEQDRAYLDCYNNVPSVGHCHPRVVSALATQAAVLNTHTRYLQEGVIEYAERLISLFPAALDTAMFTCTGSEANDLALRIACDLTGRKGLIVTANAYHGVTMALADMSPSLQPVAAHVRTVPAPDTYRVAPGEDVAARFAADVQTAIDSLREADLEPAVLMVDTVFASDGIHPEHTGALSAAAKVIRAAGGLFICDEVQGGFARTGRWWAFEREPGLVPDMVSLGKPMGAGHPVGGLVIQSPLLKQFGQRRRYFNTFGGNTVSAAVGLTVLQVIEDEDLVAQVGAVGNYLTTGLQKLAIRHACIGDIRADGLYVGLELVQDRASKTPASDLAMLLTNHLREHGILLSFCGVSSNILKIRPPLTFRQEHADQLINGLDSGLTLLHGHKHV